jgi:hypothetical protein
LRIVATKGDVLLVDFNLFAVNAGLNVNHNSAIIVLRDVVQRGLDRLEITRAIRGNSLPISHKKAQKARNNC